MGWKTLALTAIVILLATSTVRGSEMEVAFIEAGEGNAILVTSPEGLHMLIDAGNLITGHDITEYLLARGIKTLDALVVTHPHPDHMGGVFHVLQRLGASRRYDNAEPPGTGVNNAFRWYREIFRTGHYTPLANGDTIELGSLTIRVLWPETLKGNWNSNSLVLMLVHGETSFLLMADAGKPVERALLERGLDIKSDVLLVGHHGAADASHPAFLEAVSPAYAVVSVDRDNARGYPDPGVLRALESMGSEVLLTWRDGNIVFKSNGREVTLSRSKPSSAAGTRHQPHGLWEGRAHDGPGARRVQPEWATAGHTATPVPVYSRGPGSERIRPLMDNTDIYKVMTGRDN